MHIIMELQVHLCEQQQIYYFIKLQELFRFGIVHTVIVDFTL